MALKRSSEELSVEKLSMANCVDIMKRNESLGRPKLFECKTCKKRFDSFQALGGHRTSHKNIMNKLMTTMSTTTLPMVMSKKHKCIFCGEEFATGQALGGHMRKHRNELNQLEQKKKKLKENLGSGEFVEALDEKNSMSNKDFITSWILEFLSL
ncbi:hypothetical protein HAX54_009340 [Datura stramonium]|uniref:C2H2-type domain-containing protein n=1 Tax=Datura stramonium TaxID=4076 RepID=A0ABS8TGE7_DATST|nr:hypothetical protein [Datura stramonium]